MASTCEVHEIPKDKYGSASERIEVNISDDVDTFQTGRQSTFKYCTQCRVVLETWSSTDDNANPPFPGIIIDLNNPGISPFTGDSW